MRGHSDDNGLGTKNLIVIMIATYSVLSICLVVLSLHVSEGWGLVSSKKVFSRSLTALTISISTLHPSFAADTVLTKQYLSASEIVKVIEEDITQRQALITADFTRSIYSEDCVFQDEIDKYPIDKYVIGTKALFVPEESHVDLVGPVVVDSTANSVKFPFQEVLSFRLPLIHPKVKLSGSVELSRDKEGLIVYSREKWDQSVLQVLSTVFF